MNAVSTSPFNLTMLRKFNVWYSIADGNFNDPNTWRSNGKKKHNYPQPGDDVYVEHVVAFNGSNYNFRNVYVQGSLVFSDNSLTITGDLYSNGTIDMSTATICSLTLGGVNNHINSFPTPGTHSTITYNRSGDQDIMNLPYHNLVLDGSGYKNIFGNLTIGGSTTLEGYGTTLIKRTSVGKLTFIGQLNGGGTPKTVLDNSVNADLEFRGGIEIDCRSSILNLGNGNLYWNGNQTVHIGGGIPYNNYNTMLINGTHALTIAHDNTPFIINGSINGETSSSTFNVSGCLYQATNIEPMLIGIYNYNYGGTSRIGYTYNGTYILPYNSYNSLVIMGVGVKTLSAHTLLNDLIIDDGGILELSTFDFTADNTVTINNSATLVKSSSIGYTLFNGILDGGGAFNAFVKFDNSCTVEFKGGMSWDIRGLTFVAVAGCTLKYTTNNQSIDIGGSSTLLIGADILISGAIILTNQNQGFGTTGTLNGDDVLSTFNNLVSFNYQNIQQPMLTGILVSDTINSKNIFTYGSDSNQNIKAGTYYNLILQNNGLKKLSGNVSVLNFFVCTPPATLNLNSFLLTNP